MKTDSIVALPADPNDADDFDVSDAGVVRALLGRELRLLRGRLGLSSEAFAARYGIPAGEYAGYETVRLAPPAAVLAYLHVIIAEPEATARAVQRAA